jgi:hypothetical protein
MNDSCSGLTLFSKPFALSLSHKVTLFHGCGPCDNHIVVLNARLSKVDAQRSLTLCAVLLNNVVGDHGAWCVQWHVINKGLHVFCVAAHEAEGPDSEASAAAAAAAAAAHPVSGSRGETRTSADTGADQENDSGAESESEGDAGESYLVIVVENATHVWL